MIPEATIFSAEESKRFSKNAGMVAAFIAFVMIRVRLPRITQARSEPIKAFPRPIQVEARPYLQPNCPA